jgi:hypothetical protein
MSESIVRDLVIWIRKNRVHHYRNDMTRKNNEFVAAMSAQHANEIERILKKHYPNSSTNTGHRPNARNTDPGTSHAGARDVAIRAGTQKHRLLLEFYRHRSHDDGMTADEAGEAAGLTTGHWKRVSDLINEGMLEPVLDSAGFPKTRPGKAKSAQRIVCITSLGIGAINDSQ